MAYIGRGTDSISNVEVLDNITFSGASSYTLQKGSANYVPISAANILVSIDGVVQANNFSVNGSTIDFGVAIANTSTCNFILHFGIGLITTVQDGAITSTKLGSSSVTSAKMASNSIATASIIDDAITYAKMQDTSAANRVLGAASAGTVGEVQVSTDMIADAQVDESKLKISNAPTNGYFLSAQSGGSGGMTWAEAGGGGKINQTIYGSTTTAYNSNSTSYTDTTLTATITPTATSSKIIILVSQAGDFVNGDNNGTNRVSYMALFRGSGEICGQKQSCQYQFAGYNVPISFSFSVLDSPSTTSATTYKTMCKIDNPVEQHINLQQGTSRSQMILMELLA
jgi:hypothetical protein